MFEAFLKNLPVDFGIVFSTDAIFFDCVAPTNEKLASMLLSYGAFPKPLGASSPDMGSALTCFIFTSNSLEENDIKYK